MYPDLARPRKATNNAPLRFSTDTLIFAFGSAGFSTGVDVLPNSPNVRAGIDVVTAVRVCVAIPCTPDVRFVDVPAEVTHEEAATQDFSTFILQCLP